PPPHRSHPIAPPAQRKFTPPPEKKPQPQGPKKLAEIPAELLNRTGDSPLKIEDIHRALQQQAPGKIVPVSPDDVEIEEDEDGKPGDKKPHRRAIPGVAGRDERHK